MSLKDLLSVSRIPGKVRIERRTGVYPMRTNRRSSSSAMVAMMREFLRCCDASSALDEFEVTGWMGLPTWGCLPELEFFFESGLISMAIDQGQGIGGRRGGEEGEGEQRSDMRKKWDE